MMPLRIALLSGGAGWHVRDLQRSAVARGHTCTLLDFRTLRGPVAAGVGPFAEFDAVIVRTMPAGSLEQVVFRMDLLQRAQDQQTIVLNPPRALEICIDKFLATARLDAAGLPVPATLSCQTSEDALSAFEQLGGDVVVKPLFGAEGRGMIRVSDPELAWRTFRAIERSAAVIYVQKFIAHPGWDLRVFVLNGQVIAAMRRYARAGWRTNVALGGRAESAVVEPHLAQLALRASAACGTCVAGVDLLQGPSGEWYVLEVNAVPGWRALAPTTGINVADRLIEFLEQQQRR